MNKLTSFFLGKLLDILWSASLVVSDSTEFALVALIDAN